MKNIKNIDRIDDIKLLIEAIMVGILSGFIIVFYRYVLHIIEDDILKIKDIVSSKQIYILIFFIILMILAIITGKLKKLEPLSGGSGIPQVEAEMKGLINQNPIKILWTKIAGGILCALGGLSVGREGPSIQIGAMCGKLVAKALNRNMTTQRYLLTCGAGAGLSAAFNAPLAGVMFALEEIHRHISKKLLITCLTSCIIADYISKSFFGINPIFRFNVGVELKLFEYWMIILLAITLSILGMLYIFMMKKFVAFYEKINISVVYRPIIPFFIAGLLFFALPEVLGGGSLLMEVITTNNVSIKFIILLFIIKILFSMFSFNSGVAGGIFFPILVMGATVGGLFSNIFNQEYLYFFIILSMAGFLTAIVRAPLTAIILIFEMTASVKFLLPLTLVCLITYVITNYFNFEPIYEYLFENLIKNTDKNKKVNEEKIEESIIMNINVKQGCKIENMYLRDVQLPKDVLVAKIQRSNQIIIPTGNTKLEMGDELSILIYNNDDMNKNIDDINYLCSSEWRLYDRN